MAAVAAAGVAPVRRIQKLDEAVINRIAAGEVVLRPASALKEMIENSLDAKAGSVAVLVKGGGLQMLQITDTGHGIAKDDFALVCERFATSKLSKFEDLSNISSYGFRGEALASISYVSKVTITSMTAGSPCAYKATFANGKLTSEVRPCAGVKGTTITVEDMFNNMPDRKATVKSASEEYQACLAVVQKYGIHSAHKGVAFSCKKVRVNFRAQAAVRCNILSAVSVLQAGEMTPDVHIPANTSIEDAIGMVYGSSVRRELLKLEVHHRSGETARGANARFDVLGWVTNANYHSKRSAFILFINGRLVDNDALKRAVDAVFADILPKHTHPLVYLSIALPPEQLDVNVHPTKREVAFLFQDEIIDAIIRRLQDVLAGANSSRRFATQTVLTSVPLVPAGPELSTPSSTRAGTEASVPPSISQRTSAREAGAGDAILDLDAAVSTRARALMEEVSPPEMRLTGSSRGSADSASKVRRVLSATSSTGEDEEDESPAAAPAVGRRVPAAGTVELAPAVTSRRRSGPALMSATQQTQVYKTVRTQSDTQTLHAFLERRDAPDVDEPRVKPRRRAAVHEEEPMDLASELLDGAANQVSTEAPDGDEDDAPQLDDAVAGDEDAAQLDSVQSLLAAIKHDVHDGIQAMLRKHVFVGVVTRHLSMVQYNTRLLLMNHTQLARELCYQQVLRTIGRVPTVRLSPAVDVQLVCEWALRARRGVPVRDPDGATVSDLSAEELDSKAAIVADCVEVATEVASLLLEKAEMLSAYFGVGIRKISPDGRKRARRAGAAEGAAAEARVMLTHLPALLDQYTPLVVGIPDFLLSLAYDVDWQQERSCLHTVAQAIAAYYAEPPLFPGDPRTPEGRTRAATSVVVDGDGSKPDAAAYGAGSLHWVVNTVFFPAFRHGLIPPRKLSTNHHVVQVASTEQLYRIFERC